jgi:hypothetical protein
MVERAASKFHASADWRNSPPSLKCFETVNRVEVLILDPAQSGGCMRQYDRAETARPVHEPKRFEPKPGTDAADRNELDHHSRIPVLVDLDQQLPD